MTLRVVYVVGKGRSGSTLLDDVLGTMPGVASLGELRLLWSRCLDDGYLCACGAPVSACPVWRPALEAAVGALTPDRFARVERLQRRVMAWPQVPRVLAGVRTSADRELGEVLGRLYPALAEALGAQTLVDSSKWPLPPAVLGQVPGVEAWVVHLVRDPRAVAHSYRRRKGGVGQPELPRFGALHTALSWSVRNATAELARKPLPDDRFRRLRYEDLAAGPRAVVQDLGAWLGVREADAGFVDDRTVHLGEAHLIGGNPRRFERGEVHIRADQEWSDAGTTHAHRLVGAVTAPLRRRYGYGTRGGR